MHMVIVAYVLTVAVMLPASGWLADKVGVRNIFFTAIVLFTTGSLFCAQASTLDQLVMARVLQGVGGAMMVPVGRLTVMKIVPREQYMAAMTFVTLPGRGAAAGPGAGRDAGGVRLVALDFLNQPAGGHHRRDCHPGADAELHNADASLRFLRFHSAGSGHGHAHSGARRTKGLGISSLMLGVLVALGITAILWYLWHARGNDRALFSLNLFKTRPTVWDCWEVLPDVLAAACCRS